ncbi:MAG: bestrophin family protein [Opitutaceae bacterium]
MVVRDKPGILRLFFILQGSIVPAIAPKLLLIGALSTAVAWAAHRHPGLFAWVPLTPFTLLGLSLSIFLGFRNNACYDRWWEARRLWGQLIHELRSFARVTNTLFVAEPETARRLVRRAVAFPHALAARLRGEDAVAAARPWVSAEESMALALRRNPANALVDLLGADIAGALRRGAIGEMLYPVFDARLSAIAGIQAGCERILSTPLPFAYSLLLHRTAFLFCGLLPFALVDALGWFTPLATAIIAYAFFGLDALGDELEEPFGHTHNDLPLQAMARTIQIDLCDSLGEPDLPAPLVPVRHILS